MSSSTKEAPLTTALQDACQIYLKAGSVTKSKDLYKSKNQINSIQLNILT